MIKKTTKKTISKVKKVKKTYTLMMSFNGESHTIETDDLFEAIMSVKPAVLKTKILFYIKKGGLVCDKQTFVLQGKMMFRSKLVLEIFIRRLIFKDARLND